MFLYIKLEFNVGSQALFYVQYVVILLWGYMVCETNCCLVFHPSFSVPLQKVWCFLQTSWRVSSSSVTSPLLIRPVKRLLSSRSSIWWSQPVLLWLWLAPVGLASQPWSPCCWDCMTPMLVRWWDDSVSVSSLFDLPVMVLPFLQVTSL